MIQLLPKPDEARVIRNALIEYVEGIHSPETVDICWKYISKISQGLVRENQGKI